MPYFRGQRVDPNPEPGSRDWWLIYGKNQYWLAVLSKLGTAAFWIGFIAILLLILKASSQ